MNETAFNIRDRIFLFASFVLGFLLFEFVLFEGFGIGVTAFMVIFYAAVFWYLSGSPGGIEKKGLWLLIPIGLLSACFALYDNMVLAMLDFMLLYALVTLQLAEMTGCRLYKASFPGYIIDLFHAGVALPLVNIPAPFQALRRRQNAGGKLGRVGSVLIGLAICVPVLAVVLALLSSADQNFSRGMHDFMEFMGEHMGRYLMEVILGAIAAVPLFGLLWALRSKKKALALKRKIDLARVKVLNEGIAGTVMAVLSVVYLVFIVIQFSYLFGAFANIRPASFTYAEYARKGFFELMGVSVINLGVLVLSMLFSRRDEKGSISLKVLETVLVALTLLLLASAFAKMFMYMDAYGLTLLRVYVTWFMILLAVFFVAMLVKLYSEKFALARFCFGAFLTLFLALNYADVDARIPQYNIDRYTSGASKTVDVDIFYNLSDSMIPYAAKLLDMDDKATVDKAMALLADRARIRDDGRWQVFSVARQNAIKILEDRKITYAPRPGYYDPDE